MLRVQLVPANQGFIQPIILMFIFERRLNFRTMYFVKNDHKFALYWGWGSAVIVSFTAEMGGSGDKAPEKFYAFYINNSLNQRKHSKANLFLNASSKPTYLHML